MTMSKDIDMTYRFLQDDEPTDEQRPVTMQEVADAAAADKKKSKRKSNSPNTIFCAIFVCKFK
jgi:hypothetical protein